MKLYSSRILILLLSIYYILDMMFPHTGKDDSAMRILPQTAMALVGIYCISTCFFNFKKIYNSNLIRPFYWLAIIGLLYVFWVIPTETFFNNFINFMKFYMAILVMMALYISLLKKTDDAQKDIYKLFALQVVYVFYKLITDKINIANSENLLFNSNAGFMMVCCIPMTLILPQKRLRLYVYLLVVLGCLYSGQRSAALAAVLCLPFCWKHLKQYLKRQDQIIIGLLALIVIIPIIKISYDNLMARTAYDVNHGTMGSGRSTFWMIVWNQFWKNDLLNIMCGNGMNSVAPVIKAQYGIPIGAHNGWLDNLYTYGLFGLFFYGKSIFSLLVNNRIVNRITPEYQNVFITMFILFFVKSITSHGYFDITVMPFGMTIAIISYKFKNDYVKKKTCNNQ